MKMTLADWPVLIVSAEFTAGNNEGHRLRELLEELKKSSGCTVITSASYEDALEIFTSRADIGCVVADWDLEFEKKSEKMSPEKMLDRIRMRNLKIPVILLTDHLETENLSANVLNKINDCLWKTADTVEFIAGRVANWVKSYSGNVMPEFFAKLVDYSERYKYAWHTPGHLGGQGFLRAPAGVAMFKFFGENTFRSDLSISVPELGSLLDHEGAAGDAERNSARVFGADLTFYVLNGTSTVNQIIWRSQVLSGDIALVDRNCHKSLNYAMVITGAVPVYMIPRRNARGIIGPVRLSEFSAESVKKRIAAHPLIEGDALHIKMSALTNSTYDGVCYNARAVIAEGSAGGMIGNFHFDEAWYAYARFHPIYKGHYGMAEDAPPHPVFCSQSTHKLLTAFSQASMLHIRNGQERSIDPVLFNESYMMHGSTSPQYSMIASLDVATKMMDDSGVTIFSDIILEAVQLRRKMADLERQMRRKGDWFFPMWQPRKVKYEDSVVDFADCPAEYLAENQAPWVLDKHNNWHGFEDIEDDYVMLDPIKLTILTPGIGDDGQMLENGGIPAAVVSNYLIKHNIVCEKTDYYSFLLLNSLGTTRAKQGSLLAALFAFKKLYDSDAPLEAVFPGLVSRFPERYKGETLKTHCESMHAYLREHKVLELMHRAFESIPVPAMLPCEAAAHVVRGDVEMVDISEISNRIAAVMLVPYPPGIPVMMGGETVSGNAQAIADYLLAREEFENMFPGYEGDIHGITREERNGRTVFRTLCIKK
ncbi:MAG: response regulator [Lentisphaerae bacterium]|nr:response regulator [Lentisphaerota bacterium]